MEKERKALKPRKGFVQVVTNPDNGLIVTPSKKTEGWGAIRVDTEHVSMENGIFNRNSRTAFINGQIEDLEALGLEDGDYLPGKIIKKESFAPMYPDHKPKLNPSTKEVHLTEGRETYLDYKFTEDTSAVDTWVAEPVGVATAQDI